MRTLRPIVLAASMVATACGSLDRTSLDLPGADAAIGTDATAGTDATTASDVGSAADTQVSADQGMVTPPSDVPPGSDSGSPGDVPASFDGGHPLDAPPPADVRPPVDVPPPMDVPPRDAGPPDPCSSSTTCGTCTPRNGCGFCNDVGRCLTGSFRGPNNGACTSASWSWNPTDCPRVTPDAGPPVDVAPTDACRACMPFGPVAFCPGSGPGTCLAYAGCGTDGCGVCAPATVAGDNCGSTPAVLNASGHHRTVFSTCGLRDDVDTNCGIGGPDFVLTMTVARAGRVTVTFTVPAGVQIALGYDVGADGCANSRSGRTCNPGGTMTTQTLDAPLPAGTYYLYVATSQGATVVVDSTLP